MGRRIPVGMDMLEDDLLVAVLDLCKAQQLRTAHFRPALTAKGRWVTPVQGDGKGWPDLFILGPCGALFRELKRTTGKVSPEQQVWLDALRAAGYDGCPLTWPKGWDCAGNAGHAGECEPYRTGGAK